MGLKKKLGTSIAAAVLGVSLIGGGTFAYFSSAETSNNTLAAGTLDVVLDKPVIIEIDNLKPGDWMDRTFKLENIGSLDMSKVLLLTDYTQSGVKGDEDIGKHIQVNFLKNFDKETGFNDNVIYHETLYNLKNASPDTVQGYSSKIFKTEDGLAAGEINNLYVQFEFVDNEEDQNAFQDATLQLKWTFDAKQTEGESK
ncbi:TasA family protein [Virgibacillus halophilus]|uniref:TasA family protein n=1 Tax=Tigheibacillus halophilus TaxID=361280 RepID=A0ABU5C250_9BACI|nr:TasA family protein [Virgibacillus halophilus]